MVTPAMTPTRRTNMNTTIQLDERQQAAVDSTAKKILACAGPGSGKTRVIVQRILRLVSDGVDSREIVAITYTNAAADEMAHRLGGIKIGFFGTLHAFVLSLVQSHYHVVGFRGKVTVIDDDATKELLASVIATQRFRGSLTQVKDLISQGIPTLPPTPSKPDLVAKGFYDELVRTSTIDVDSILIFGDELLSRMPEIGIRTDASTAANHLFVDEIQDCSDKDFGILEKLPIENKFLVGDPDQSIFGFRGGSVRHINALFDNPKWTVFLLENNYRSHVEITQPAQYLIEHNIGRVNKKTTSVSGPGGTFKVVVPFVDAGQERAWVMQFVQNMRRATVPVPDSEIAILLRTNHYVASFSEYLKNSGIPVVERTRKEVPPDWQKARLVIALLANPDNDHLAYKFHVERDGKELADKVRLGAQENFVSINQFALHVEPVMLPMLLEQIHVSEITSKLIRDKALTIGGGNLDFNDLAMALNEEMFGDTVGEGVTVSTMHGAKGLEWRVVILPAFEQEIIPGQRKEVNFEEERRLAYVAMTRAKDCLVVTSCEGRTRQWTGDRIFPHTPSQFLKESLTV